MLLSIYLLFILLLLCYALFCGLEVSGIADCWLLSSLNAGLVHPLQVSVEVEKALFLDKGGVTADYKSKLLSLAFNLKDKNNPDLRRKVGQTLTVTPC